MKKYFLFISLLFAAIAIAQNKISFTDTNIDDANLSQLFKSYKVVKINDELKTIADGREFVLNYGKTFMFTLQENRLYTQDYEVTIKKENGIEKKNIEQLGFDGKYFNNADRTSTHQMAFSIYDNQYTFYVKSGGEEFYIEPLIKYVPEAEVSTYVFYKVADIIDDNQNSCGVNEKNSSRPNTDMVSSLQAIDNCKTVELNMCIDYSMYATYNSINGSVNRVFEILNMTQLDYTIANGLAFDVNFKLKRMFILTCMSCNYWPSTNNIFDNMESFGLSSNFFPMFDYASDIRVFWQDSYDTSIYNYIQGYADQPTLAFMNCSTTPLVTARQVCIKNRIFNTNSTRSVLSHEFGHNFSCPHVNDSPNIMYGAGYLGNVWNNTSIATINTVLSQSNCYYNCETETCFNTRVENPIAAIDQSNNTINLSWLSETGMQYKVRLYNFATSTWSAATILDYPLNTTAFTYTNDPSACERFKIEIVPVCSGIDGFSEIIVLNIPNAESPNLSFTSTAQNGNLCSGISYTFTVSAQYPGANPIYRWRINNTEYSASNPFFTTSNLQNNDILSCQIISNDPCLGTSFATVSKTVTVLPQPCNLSNVAFENDDFDYFPNPVNDFFTLKSINEMQSIGIYNILGQKVLEKKIQKNETTLDLSFLASSTYMVKIESNGNFHMLKFIKQ